MVLEISRAQVDAMIEHAKEEYPNECCGMLAGRENRVERVYRVKNVLRSPVLFHLDPDEQHKVDREIEALGLELVGFYHSHPATRPYPSPTDGANAFYKDSQTGETRALYPNAGYLIVSLRDQRFPEIRAFRIGDGSFLDEELAVV